MELLLDVMIAFLFILISLIPVKAIEKEVDDIEYNDKKKANIYKQIYLLYGMYAFAEFVILVILLSV